MKRILLTLCCLVGLNSFSQADPLYTNYNFNGLAVNPAYAGTRNSISAVALYRSKWVGMDGAPTSQAFSIHTPSNKSNFAGGLNLVADQLGPTSNVFAGITGAYQVKFRVGKLSMGLRAGLFNSVLRANEFSFKDESDPLFGSERTSNTIASFDAGFYYYTSKFYVGLAVTHLGDPKLKYEQFSEASFPLRKTTTLGMGYAFEINEKLVLKPNFLLKVSDSFNGNLDAGISALLYEKAWVGISFRQNSSVNLLLNFNITDFMRIGYSYDYQYNQLNIVSKGAHELFLGFDFSLNKVKVLSPRYL